MAETEIREALPTEYAAIGRLTAETYAALPGMPGPDKAPDYYHTLHDVASRAQSGAITVFAAIDRSAKALTGSVDFVHDLTRYGQAEAVQRLPDAAGIRLLAVRPEYQGQGIGKRLTEKCLAEAKRLGRRQVILHTTYAMRTAWGMYERLGFKRLPELDFRRGELGIFGFRLKIES